MKYSMLIIFLLLCSGIAYAQEDKKQGVTPDSWLWNVDVFFDNVQGMFSSKARVHNDAERLAELDAMIAKDDAIAADRVMVRVREREQVRQQAADRLDGKFELDDARLLNIQQEFNERFGGKYDFVEGNVLVKVRTFDNSTLEYRVLIENNSISEIEIAGAGTDYVGTLELSQGEMYSLGKRDAAGLVGIARRFKFDEDKQQTIRGGRHE